MPKLQHPSPKLQRNLKLQARRFLVFGIWSFEFCLDCRQQAFANQRALARAADAGDHDKSMERNRDGQILQIVDLRVTQREPLGRGSRSGPTRFLCRGFWLSMLSARIDDRIDRPALATRGKSFFLAQTLAGE